VADHDVTFCRHRLDRVCDEAAQLIASWRRQLVGYGRGKTSGSHHCGRSGRAELIEDAPQQRLPLLGVRDELRRGAGPVCRRRNDLLVDVAEPELIRHEPRHVVAARSVAMRDADQRPLHALDVTPLTEQWSTTQ
jgi:hypothetical protein